MSKPYLIIVEGPQGVGKSALTTGLREKIPSTTLVRLAGTKEVNSEHSFRNHKSVLDMVRANVGLQMNFVFDRSYFSEDVYCRLGYKPYSFRGETKVLSDMLNALTPDYQIFVILLGAREDVLRERLLRDKPMYKGVEFSVANSMNQFGMYVTSLYPLSAYGGITLVHIDTSDIDSEAVLARSLQLIKYEQ